VSGWEKVARVPKGSPEGGRWTGPGGHMRAMFDRISQPDGGFTYRPLDDAEAVSGYAVSTHPERSFGKDAADLSFDDLVDYAIQNNDLLSRPGHYLGAWHDPETHRVYLDISQVTNYPAEAAQLALAHDQIAYFDLGAGHSVTVNQQASSGGAAH
jgi:hypothetical protein